MSAFTKIVLAIGVAVFAATLLLHRSSNQVRERTVGEAAPQEPAARPLSATPPAPRAKAKDLRTAASAAPKETPESDLRKEEILSEVLESRNDNDPRLDIQLRYLSEGAKARFRAKYEKLSPERRDGRGTVVFLVGRNITSPADLDFLGKVIAEPPCLSLADCKAAPPPSREQDPDHNLGVDVTLAYPQIVAVKSLEAYLQRPDRDPALAGADLALLRKASQSPVPVIARAAAASLSKLGQG